ncbi:uncharacterized protein BX663DRAFT_528261, partial [Cokeromyces recurvatus]|uniref:uncharacterized protein n=1 Tax=Cokeromyces recurvatus TaxID=90255 RepID=UPI00221F23A8
GIETWSSEFEEASKLSIVPVMRIYSPIAVKLNYIDNGNKLLIINLPRKLLIN